jgi:hypothetical protein
MYVPALYKYKQRKMENGLSRKVRFPKLSGNKIITDIPSVNQDAVVMPPQIYLLCKTRKADYGQTHLPARRSELRLELHLNSSLCENRSN